MACNVKKKLLGYEICTFDREGTLFCQDPIVVVRKEHFTEIYNLQKHDHEIGDRIVRDVTRNIIYEYIDDSFGEGVYQ